jgi:hypothetical protein
MPLKGVMLGALGIVDPADRPISDVDLLIFGGSLRWSAARLAQAGFRLMDVPLASGYLSMLPANGPLSVDLHTRLVPFGLGHVPARIMLGGAERRDDLFDASVEVPTRERLAFHVLVNIIKDRVVHALPHNAHDLRALLRELTHGELISLARNLEKAALRRAGALALLWARESANDVAFDTVLGALSVDAPLESTLHGQLARWQRHDHADLASRMRARSSADRLDLRLAAPLAAGLDLLGWPLRSALLHAQTAWLTR